MVCATVTWRTYSRVIKDVWTRVVDLIWRDKNVSRADLFLVDKLDVKEGRVNVWPLQGQAHELAISQADGNSILNGFKQNTGAR